MMLSEVVDELMEHNSDFKAMNKPSKLVSKQIIKKMLAKEDFEIPSDDLERLRNQLRFAIASIPMSNTGEE